jgi:RimJ/RimL family protein N-acetyltransferase
MVDSTTGATRLALTRVPDEPRWVDTRGMLLSGRASGRFPGHQLDTAGFVVAVSDSALASVVGKAEASLIADVIGGLAGDVNVLSQMEDADHVAEALGSWRRRRAIIHVLPAVREWEHESEPNTRVFTAQSAPRLNHVPDGMRRELLDALRGRTVSRFVPGQLPHSSRVIPNVTVPMAAVWADGRPVSFCYPVWQTETLWDVSIETLEAYRRKGFAARAARTMIRYMRHRGRAPVWGALETNVASRRLAARLGFVENAGIAVFTAG